MPGTLVLLRHGESTWNLENLFTGWHDVAAHAPRARRRRSRRAGDGRRRAALRRRPHVGARPGRASPTTSPSAELGQVWLPVQRHWRLNERHYGALQGLDKSQTAERHGAEQTKLWRRSYDVPPPPVADDSPEHPANDRRYRSLAPEVLPGDRVPRRRGRAGCSPTGTT